MFEDIEVEIKVELGSAIMPVHHVLRLGRGAVIELETTENDPMLVYANDKLIANGDIQIKDGQLTVEVLEKILT